MKNVGMKKLVLFFGIMLLTGAWTTDVSAKTTWYYFQDNVGRYYFRADDYIGQQQNVVMYNMQLRHSSDSGISYGLILYDTVSGSLTIKVFDDKKLGFTIEAVFSSNGSIGYFIDSRGNSGSTTLSLGSVEQ